MHIFPIIFLYATWSSIFSIGKLALSYSPPLFLTAVRMLIAGVALILYLAFKTPASFRIKKNLIFPLILLAIFSHYLANAFEFSGLQYLSAAKTCFIYSLSPFFAAFLSYIHFGEKMNLRKWGGMTIGFAGCLPVILQSGFSSGFFTISWPELELVAAAFCGVYGWVLMRMLVKEGNLTPLMANGLGMLIGGIFALIHSYFFEIWNPSPIASGHLSSFLQSVLIITLISNLICYNLYAVLLKRFTATFMSFMGLLSPIFASLHGWFFLGESISPLILLSTGVVSVGLWLVHSAELSQGYTKSASSPSITG